MKKLCFTILLISVVSHIFGQTNIDLKFTGAYNTNYLQLDSIKIENLTQNGDTMLYYPDTTLSFSIIGQSENLIKNAEFTLYQNYPNPVLDNTTIKLYIPEKDKVVIKITDLLGRLTVLNEQILEPGYHSFIFTPGIANIYIVSAKWRGNTRNIKIINRGNGDGNTFSYSTKIGNNRCLKSLKSSKGINFSIGDSLKFTGYSFSLEDIIKDTFGLSTNYTFQFYQSAQCPSAFIDFRDYNVYQAVQIGTQCWMSENLAFLPLVYSPNQSSPAYSYYVIGYHGTSVSAAKATSNYQTYGVLYTWVAAMQAYPSSNSVPSGVPGACPTGWHLPSIAEWDILANYLGGSNVAGGKLKETGTAHWNSPNTGATNSSGFSGLPGGYVIYNSFSYLGERGSWWSTLEMDSFEAWFTNLNYSDDDVQYYFDSKPDGRSMRCIKD